jgi:glucan phosphoethanolaminetransferase (alkaline phosphatase superfamily)
MMEKDIRSTAPEALTTPDSASSFWQRTGPLHGLLFMLAAEMIVSAACLNYFCRSFKISRALIAIHLPLVAGLFVITALAPAVLLYIRTIRRCGFTRYFLALGPVLGFVLLLVLYVFDFASNIWMGSNVNYKLARLYFSELSSGHDILFLSRWVYFSLAAFAIFVLAVYLCFAKTIFKGWEELLLPGHANSLFSPGSRRFKSFAIIGLILFAYAFYFYALLRRAPYSELLSSDPIVGLIRSTTEVYDENYPAFLNRLREQEQQCRASYPRDLKFEKKNVVIIIVDALRPDHTQLYGYNRPTTPFLESLFETGRLRKVEFATSTCGESKCGIVSTLYSKTLRRQIATDFKLQDLLHDQGYRTYFILSGNHSAQGIKEMHGDELTLYFDGKNSINYSGQDDRLIFEGFEKVPSYTDTPGFFYIHLMSAHLNGLKQEAYRLYQPSDVKSDWLTLVRGELDRTSAINNYDNGVTQADATIREIFGALAKKGYLQNSIVVILSDHGEGLGERGKASFGHGSLYQEFIRIPLLIYDESPTNYANLKFATQIDVAPTIVDRLGLPIPACWQGISLLNANIRAVTTHQSYLKNHPCYAVLYRTDATIYKYMYCTADKGEELYDLTSDPGEQLNLIDMAEPTLIQRLRDELARSLADSD